MTNPYRPPETLPTNNENVEDYFYQRFPALMTILIMLLLRLFVVVNTDKRIHETDPWNEARFWLVIVLLFAALLFYCALGFMSKSSTSSVADENKPREQG